MGRESEKGKIQWQTKVWILIGLVFLVIIFLMRDYIVDFLYRYSVDFYAVAQLVSNRD